MLANMQAITMNWPSPITLEVVEDNEKEVTVLLQSSQDSWSTTDINIQPDMDVYPELGFPISSERTSQILAVSMQGLFESFFMGNQSPLERIDEQTGEAM